MNNYDLLKYLNELLQIDKFRDYCPNGLQIEGNPNITNIITGVSLTQNLIDIAIAKNANAIIVHHGIFWNSEDPVITKIKKDRIAKLLNHNINLYAYHLPLDNHSELGNNVQLAKILGFSVLGNTAEQNLLWYGKLYKPCTINDFLIAISEKLRRIPKCFAKDIDTDKYTKIIETVAWCTGGADKLFTTAINLGVDAYVTGECSEPTMSMADESGVCFVGAGHYATERYGIMALTDYLKNSTGLNVEYIELFNPI